MVSALDCFVGDFLFGGVVSKMKPWKSMGPQKMLLVCVFEQLNLQIFGSLMKNIVFFWFVIFGSRKNLISKEGFGVSNDGQN